LEDGKLKYFKSEKDKKEAGFLAIDKKSEVKIVEEPEYKYTFVVSSGSRNLEVYADSESEMIQWIFAIRASILN
jgi:hypothetical protein